MIELDLNEAKLESLKRSEQVREVDEFVNGKKNVYNKSNTENKDITDNNSVDWSQF